MSERDETPKATFVTEDAALSEGGIVRHDIDEKVIESARTGEGLIPVTPEMFQHLVQAAGETMAHFEQQITPLIDEDRAREVRRLRVDNGYTWRAVAQACSDDWGGDWGSNQLAGMAICERAAEMLGEHYMAEPWN